MQLSARPIRILSLLVLLAVTNVYVFVNGAAISSAKTANEAGTAKVLIGKLVTTSNRPILVNGGEAITGTSILSGAQLVTSATSLATVQLDNLGSVKIAPSSNVSLNFDAKSVTVRVASGDATVTTVEGVTGTVVGPGGNVVAPGAAPATSSAQTWGIAGVAVGGAALIWAIIAWNRANDARDSAAAANASAASLAAQLAALRTCLAGQTTSPLKLCTSF